MQRKVYWALLPVLLVVLALGLGACGDDDEGGGGGLTASDFEPVLQPPDDAKKGGTLKVIAAGDVDYIDPGASYYQFTYMETMATQRTLVGWPADETKEPQPDIAEAAPEVSEDGKTVTFKIQPGIKFSPPVNREVRAADFKYAIERALMPGVPNPYVPIYLAGLVGFEDAQAAVEKDPTTAPDIKGITAPDDSTLVLKFDDTTSAAAIQALSLPAGAPVPEEYAKKYDSESPSTYGTHQVATGPYMIENDDQGNLTGYSPGKEIILVRNPNWDASTDYRPAFLDRIEFQEGFSDVNSATRKILRGDSEVNGDILPEPEGLKEAATQFPEQLSLALSGGNRYVSLNTQIPPFNDINVRKAVLAAADREAYRLERGGELVGPIATHFIPPEIPGFEEAGGESATVDYLENPRGDMQLAAEYMKKAGFKSGKYEGNEEILVVGENAGVDKRVAEAVRDTLDQLGFKLNFQQVSSDTAYTKFCGVPKAEVAVCPNTGWLKDFNDPQTILDVPFNGESIVPLNNSNWPQLDVPAINKAMDEARLIVDEGERAKAWGEIDKMIVEQAPAIPYVWDLTPNVASANVNGVINAFNGTYDLAYTSVK